MNYQELMFEPNSFFKNQFLQKPVFFKNIHQQPMVQNRFLQQKGAQKRRPQLTPHLRTGHQLISHRGPIHGDLQIIWKHAPNQQKT